jgi:hypothetical protein
VTPRSSSLPLIGLPFLNGVSFRYLHIELHCGGRRARSAQLLAWPHSTAQPPLRAAWHGAHLVGLYKVADGEPLVRGPVAVHDDGVRVDVLHALQVADEDAPPRRLVCKVSERVRRVAAAVDNNPVGRDILPDRARQELLENAPVCENEYTCPPSQPMGRAVW